MNAVLLMIGGRLCLGFLTLAVIAVFIFSVVELLPGDLAQAVLGQSATPETVAAFRRELGLDKPPLERFADWATGVLSGDFGNSLANGREVSELVAGRLGNTLFLAAYAVLIAVPLALALGIAAALYRNTFFDRAANVGALSAISLPEFFVAYILVLAFSVSLPWFPSLSNITPDSGFGEKMQKTFLPAITLTLVVVAHMMRMTRAAIINLLASPYIEMARLKGLPAARVIIFHALPNAMAPIVNVIAVNLAYLVVGVVVVEVVFVYPGLGQLMVDSVSKRDIPVVQATSLIFASVYILLNLTADIIAILSNPRLLHPR
ncbi:MAG: ABC transporter permease [Gammaproteobacteria bacterium]